MVLNGGKSYLAKKIVDLMPPRQSRDCPSGYVHYCEPYFGGGAVLLANDPEGISECVNDINANLVNFWLALKSPESVIQLITNSLMQPVCESIWDSAKLYLENETIKSIPDAQHAFAFLVVCRQSLMGMMKEFAPLSKTRTRRGMNEQVSAWFGAIEGLEEVHNRLRRVVILGPSEACEVIEKEDSPTTLFYCDPPYLEETRSVFEVYGDGDHEMTYNDHCELLRTLATIEGRFLLSGYPSELYETFASKYGWRHVDFKVPNQASMSDEKRGMTERVWMNYA